ncbi:hypothetical protein Q7P37_004693 [Cladosporium fusiforme]
MGGEAKKMPSTYLEERDVLHAPSRSTREVLRSVREARGGRGKRRTMCRARQAGSYWMALGWAGAIRHLIAPIPGLSLVHLSALGPPPPTTDHAAAQLHILTCIPLAPPPKSSGYIVATGLANASPSSITHTGPSVAPIIPYSLLRCGISRPPAPPAASRRIRTYRPQAHCLCRDAARRYIRRGAREESAPAIARIAPGASPPHARVWQPLMLPP